MGDPDGSKLLTSDEVGNLLRTAVKHAGGVLQSWALDHIDANPQRSTTATYVASVEWPHGVRKELLGVSARAGGLARTDERAAIFADGDREVAVWIYPKDPDLPGLERAAYPTEMAAVLNEYRVFPTPVGVDQIRLDMIGYRPRRRAVLKCTVTTPPRVLYVKVLRERLFEAVKLRHDILLGAGVPAPPVLAATSDNLLVLDELPGRPLARAIFDDEAPTTAERLIRVLDDMPASAAALERRPPWAEAVDHYTRMVSQAMPVLAPKLDWMAEQIKQGLAGCAEGTEATHGDFHEGQIHVRNGQVAGILDIDTVGPGRRADDLACLIAHLSTVQRMNTRQAERVHDLLRTWVPVFDERVDPAELRLRSAAVIISLATGPYRSQEPHWEQETQQIVDAAQALVKQVA